MISAPVARERIRRTGDGYRYDYLHAGPAIANLIVSCEYLHETRLRRLSDHAALTLTLDAHADRVETISPTAAAADSAPTLF